MAKMSDTKMQVSLDNDSKRIIRGLTKAIDRLSRNLRPAEVQAPKRLSEPADDPATANDYQAGVITDEEMAEMRRDRAELFEPAVRTAVLGKYNALL